MGVEASSTGRNQTAHVGGAGAWAVFLRGGGGADNACGRVLRSAADLGMPRAPKRFDMPDRDPPIPSVPDARAVPRKQTRLSPVWLIPILAAALGVWVAVARIRSEGPKITIVFQSAEGLEAGKTKINYRGVDIGTITAIRLTEDHERVIATAQMTPTDRGFSGRGHAAVGGAAAHLGRQRDRVGHPHLRGLYRGGNRQFKGAQARLRGARDAAGGDRQRAWTFLRAEDLRPGFAGHRHAAVLPASAGRSGRVIRSWTRTESSSPSRYS